MKRLLMHALPYLCALIMIFPLFSCRDFIAFAEDSSSVYETEAQTESRFDKTDAVTVVIASVIFIATSITTAYITYKSRSKNSSGSKNTDNNSDNTDK